MQILADNLKLNGNELTDKETLSTLFYNIGMKNLRNFIEAVNLDKCAVKFPILMEGEEGTMSCADLLTLLDMYCKCRDICGLAVVLHDGRTCSQHSMEPPDYKAKLERT